MKILIFILNKKKSFNGRQKRVREGKKVSEIMKEFNLFAWKENVSEPFYIKIQLRYRSLFCACETKSFFSTTNLHNKKKLSQIKQKFR